VGQQRHFSDDPGIQALAEAMYWRGAPESRVVSYAETLKDVGVGAGEIVDWAEVFVPTVAIETVAKGVAAPTTKRGGKILATVRGIATSERKDLQGEKILQDGVDWRYFLAKGWLNDVHDKGTGGGLGYPTTIKHTKVKGKDGVERPATEFEGVLLDTQKSRDILDLYKALDGHDRAIGSSIQGPVILRLDDTGNPAEKGKTIAKMLAIDLSLTRHPVNVDTYGSVDLCEKSIDALGRKLRFAMSADSAAKDTTAGHPAPTYDGGGSAAPLFRQDHNRRPSMKRAVCKDANVQKYLDGLKDDDYDNAAKAMKAAGVQFDDGADDEPDNDKDDAEKALAEYDAKLAAAMADVKDHLEKGGKILFAEGAEAEATVDTTGTLRTVHDTLQQVVSGINGIAKGMVLLAKYAEVAKGIQSGATPAQPVDLSGVEKSLGALSERLESIEKDLGGATVSRFVRRPADGSVAQPGGAPGKVDQSKVRDAAFREFSRAERIADDAEKSIRMDELAAIFNKLDTGIEVTAKDLTQFNVTL
jgi:hypothetical protein